MSPPPLGWDRSCNAPTTATPRDHPRPPTPLPLHVSPSNSTLHSPTSLANEESPLSFAIGPSSTPLRVPITNSDPITLHITLSRQSLLFSPSHFHLPPCSPFSPPSATSHASKIVLVLFSQFHHLFRPCYTSFLHLSLFNTCPSRTTR